MPPRRRRTRCRVDSYDQRPSANPLPFQCGAHILPHLLNIVIAQSPSIFELLSSKDQSLLVWRDPFFVLDFAFDVVDRVARFNLESDGLAREGLDEAMRIVSVHVVNKSENAIFVSQNAPLGTKCLHLH